MYVFLERARVGVQCFRFLESKRKSDLPAEGISMRRKLILAAGLLFAVSAVSQAPTHFDGKTWWDSGQGSCRGRDARP